jgi:hypothetical protein
LDPQNPSNHWKGSTLVYLKAYALPPTLNWGFGLNGLHIESCLVCLAFMA